MKVRWKRECVELVLQILVDLMLATEMSRGKHDMGYSVGQGGHIHVHIECAAPFSTQVCPGSIQVLMAFMTAQCMHRSCEVLFGVIM